MDQHDEATAEANQRTTILEERTHVRTRISRSSKGRIVLAQGFTISSGEESSAWDQQSCIRGLKSVPVSCKEVAD
eukprot:12909793-Prorocentrum_lima.AAC.1